MTLSDRGWQVFPHDPALDTWVQSVRPEALATARDPRFDRWHLCQGTWFAGVNALGNDATGAVGGSGPLRGRVIDYIRDELGHEFVHEPGWDRAQVSIVYPGYPKPRDGETAAAARYRLHRDAAHVDGLAAEGPDRRRHLKEPHAFILGLPLTDCSADASPLVVWEGSHRIMTAAFARQLAGLPSVVWGEQDLTETYHQARKLCFETCRRATVPARPGQATLVHRHALHGVAPWAETATAPPDGRAIAYFRPLLANVADWLSA